MNITDQNDLIPMTLGDTLRVAREKKGLSIDSVAAEIRVKPAVLEAIEANETGHIPRVYLKGYIRTYASRLGIRPDDIECRIGEAPCTEPPVQSVFSRELPRDRSERWFKATSYLLASAVVIALVWQFTAEAVRFSQGDALPRASAVNPVQPLSSGEGQRTADQQPEPPEAARADGPKSHLRASIASVESARPSAQVERRSVAEGAWAAVGNRTETADLASETGSVPLTAQAALAIATSADSWVEIVDGNGQKIEMDLLRAGSRREYSGVEPFRLLLGRASSIELSYNGRPVDLGPHTRGNVARVTLGGVAQTEAPDPALDAEPSRPASPEPPGDSTDQG